MKVRTIATTDIVRALPDDPLLVAAATMTDNEIGSLPVFRGETMIGILTERDLVRAVAEDADASTATVGEYMSTQPVTIEADADLHDAAHRMLEGGVRHLPVLDEGEVVGLVSIRDVLVEDAWPEDVEDATLA